jgi:hypothetical protein
MTKKITLEDLEVRRKQVLADIRRQEAKMGATCRNTFRPLKEATSLTDSIARTVKSAVSLYQGALWGYRIVRFFGGGGRHKK